MAGTLDDLAALTGVSRATVSRVINGGSVSEATRERVMEVLERTGYRPNLAARTLASGRSGVVGVVMHVDSHELFQDPYFSQLLQGMSDTLSETATGMMLWLGNRSKQETLDQILRMGLMEGVIVTAYNLEDPLVDGLLASSVPTVLVGHRRADRSASYVDVDHVRAADAVTSHLVDIGRRRIGHITGRRGTVAGEDRIVGYAAKRWRGRACRRMGSSSTAISDDPRASPEPSSCWIATSMPSSAPTTRPRRAPSKASGRAACARPEDVALAGFDDLDFAAELDPPLTTVRQGIRAQGAEAAHTLSQLLDDPDGGPRRVILPTELVIRRSTVGGVRAP